MYFCKRKQSFYNIMKKVFTLLAVGVMLFAGCKPRVTDVDPDSVFGQHYTAWDFQVWSTLNDSDEAYAALLSMMDIDSSVNDIGYGLQVSPADTTEVMAKALDACRIYADIDTSQCYMPVWQQINDVKLVLLFAYGFNEPDTEMPILFGSEVKNARTYYDKAGGIEVAMVLNNEAADQWARFTADNIGRNVIFMLGQDCEGRVLSSPRIMCEITGGRFSVAGLTVDEAHALVKILNNK